MAKSTNKTQPTSVSPLDFIDGVENEARRKDALKLLDIFTRTTGLKPVMWGPSIIGFGRYHYKYDTGREDDFLMTGFSPRKANLVLYIMPGYRDMSDKLARLGKYKIGKSCLYINRLSDVDETVLTEIINEGVQYMRARYETWEA